MRLYTVGDNLSSLSQILSSDAFNIVVEQYVRRIFASDLLILFVSIVNIK